MSGIHIGTSGWCYRSWHRVFYPPKLPASRHFEFYATQFSTVEINATFYRLPSDTMVQGWARKAPPGFLFAIKGSRFITHMKKLVGVEDALATYFERVEHMRPRVAVVLWQLPPSLGIDIPRLARFLDVVPTTYRHAVEFRNLSWFSEEVFEFLRSRSVANVSLSSLSMPMNLNPTSDTVYIRFHGLVGGCAHDYTREELEPWAAHVQQQAQAGRNVFVYFNNDADVRAPANARMFREMLTG